MKITLLGTSAWDPIPAPWCSCRTCASARRHGGREIRRHTSCWIDGETLVDFGPDLLDQCRTFGVDLRDLKRVVQTHAHCDHLAPEMLMGHRDADSVFRLIGSREVEERVLRVCNAEGRALGLRDPFGFERLGIEPLRARHGVEIVDGDLRVLPIRAAHVGDEEAFNYLLTGRDGAKLLILNDTGVWSRESFDLAAGCRADAAIVEITYGTNPARPGACDCHLSAEEALDFLDQLRLAEALKPTALCIGTHIAHTMAPPHPALEKLYAGRGLSIAYDGMALEIRAGGAFPAPQAVPALSGRG